MTYKEFRKKLIGLSKMIHRAGREDRSAELIERLRSAIFNLIEEYPEYNDA